MGVMGFLFIFLILILLVFPLLTKRGTISRGTALEVKGADGTVLVFSDEGVSVFRNGEFHFFKKEEITELSIKRKGKIYLITLKAGQKSFEIPAKQEEVEKLFVRRGDSFDFAVPWLPLIVGTTLPLLLFEELEHLNDREVRELDLGNPPESSHDYFDTGDWPDDDVEV